MQVVEEEMSRAIQAALTQDPVTNGGAEAPADREAATPNDTSVQSFDEELTRAIKAAVMREPGVSGGAEAPLFEETETPRTKSIRTVDEVALRAVEAELIGDSSSLDTIEAPGFGHAAVHDEGAVPEIDESVTWSVQGDFWRWYRLAKEQNDATAQCNLGLVFANGTGVQRDNTVAAKWFRLAAEQGDSVAQLICQRRSKNRPLGGAKVGHFGYLICGD